MPIEHCPLLCDQINGLLKTISGKPEYISGGNLKVISGDDGLTSDPLLPSITKSVASIRVGDFRFEVNGGSFFQSNRFLLEQLGNWAKPLVGGDFCVDLFGGTGFFSIMLSNNFKRGLLIESVDAQVQMANKNYASNGIFSFTAQHCSAEQVQSAIPVKPDLLIIDPPRPGLTKKAREGVKMVGAEKILYVSCNPSTQARDICFLTKQCGYAIEKMALFDLYPNTHHLETAILLGKYKS